MTKMKRKTKTKKFKISRVFVTRWSWTVSARTKKAALAMLNDDSATPTDLADEEWLGPIGSTSDLNDKAEEQ